MIGNNQFNKLFAGIGEGKRLKVCGGLPQTGNKYI
jgi:hypothetical protein